MKKPMRCVLCLLLLVPAVLTAAAPGLKDAQPVDRAQILHELDALEKIQSQQAGKNAESRRKFLETAAAGGTAAAGAFEKAVQELHTGSNADFAAWSRKNGDLLRSEAMQNAIMFHARYLLIGLEAERALGKKTDPAPAAREFFAYARNLAASMEKQPWFAAAPREARELLDKPAKDQVFVRSLGLADYLPGKDEWEEKPGNIDGILEKNVREPLRESKDATVLAAWDFQIGLLKERAARASKAEAAKITDVDLPRAIYGRACDKQLFGLPNSSASDILTLAKQHPGHPDWPKWAQSLRAQLSDEPAGGEPAR